MRRGTHSGARRAEQVTMTDRTSTTTTAHAITVALVLAAIVASTAVDHGSMARSNGRTPRRTSANPETMSGLAPG